MIVRHTQLVPNKNKTEVWLQRNSLDLDDSDAVEDVWNQSYLEDGELKIIFSFGATKGRKYILDQWQWGGPKDIDDLKLHVANTFGILNSSHLSQVTDSPLFIDLFVRLFINKRYYEAVGDYVGGTLPKSLDLPVVDDLNKSVSGEKSSESITKTTSTLALDSLAQVGSKVALSFAFTFLKRAWRSSEDSDLCTDLLQDTLLAFRALPPASMYDVSKVSRTLVDVVERSKEFLKSVASGDLLTTQNTATAMSSSSSIPILDQHLAVDLLLEISFQKGTLSSMMETLIYLLNLWESRRQEPDQRKNPHRTSAPLVSFLKRVKGLTTKSLLQQQEFEESDCLIENDFQREARDTEIPDPNDVLLANLFIPEREDVSIDFQQMVVVIMAYLNRLTKHLLNKNQDTRSIEDDIIMFGQKDIRSLTHKVFKFNSSDKCTIISKLNNVKLTQVATGNLFSVALSDSGEIFVTGNFKEWSNEGLMTERTNSTEKIVKLINGSVKFVKIAMYPMSSYFLALSDKGLVYICGKFYNCPMGEMLNESFFENLESIENLLQLRGMGRIHDIACGRNYIVLVAESGKVYTWNKLQNADSNRPCLLEYLRKRYITSFSCSVTDSHALALTNDDEVILFAVNADGELKVMETADMIQAQLAETFQGQQIEKIYAGNKFSSVITSDGCLYIWGNSVGGLVHEESQHVLVPTLVENAPKTKSVFSDSQAIYIISQKDEVFRWKRGSPHNNFERWDIFAKKKIMGISIGSHHNIAWGIDESNTSTLPPSIPYVLQPTKEALSQIDLLLSKLCANLSAVWPPSQERECMAVATLNMLWLQLQESVIRSECIGNQDIDCKFLSPGCVWPCLASIKTNVVYLASTPGITLSIQSTAQKCLSIGWHILLPSATERSETLCQVLQSALESKKPHPAQTFLVDLLLESLLVGKSLELLVDCAVSMEETQTDLQSCLKEKTIRVEGKSDEESDSEYVEDEDAASKDNTNLMILVGLILKKLNRQTLLLLKRRIEMPESFQYAQNPNSVLYFKQNIRNKSAFKFLHKLQTILVGHLVHDKRKHIIGSGCLMKKYVLLISEHVGTILSEALSIADDSLLFEVSREEKAARFFSISQVVEFDGGCALLSPMITALLVVQLTLGEENSVFFDNSRQGGIVEFDTVKKLKNLLKILDSFISFAPSAHNEDEHAQQWTRLQIENKAPDPFEAGDDSLPFIRSEDFENHNKDGGHWVVHEGKVYNAEQNGDANFKKNTKEQIYGSHILVGKYLSPEGDVPVPLLSFNKKSTYSKFCKPARALAVLLATHLSHLQNHALTHKRLENVPENIRSLLKCGLEDDGASLLRNNYDKDHSELSVCESMSKMHSSTKLFLMMLVGLDHISFDDFKSSEINIRTDSSDDIKIAASHFLKKIDQLCKKFGHVTQTQTGSRAVLDQFGRWYIACLLKHHDLADAALTYSLFKNTCKHIRLPTVVNKLCHAVVKVKIQIIQEHQSSQKSYADICNPLIVRLCFLLLDVGAQSSLLLETLSSEVISPQSRWKIAFQLWKKQKKNKIDSVASESDSEDTESKDDDDDLQILEDLNEAASSSESVKGQKKIHKEKSVVKKFQDKASGKGNDYWKLIFDVASNKTKLNLLAQRINGYESLNDDITKAVTEFSFKSDIDIPHLRKTMMHAQTSVLNATGALYTAVDILKEKYTMSSIPYCLQSAWGNLLDPIFGGINVKSEEEIAEKEAAEKTKKEELDKKDPRERWKPVIKPNIYEVFMTHNRPLPISSYFLLELKMARVLFKMWTIDQVRLAVTQLLTRGRKMSEMQENLSSFKQTTMIDRESLVSESRLLLTKIQMLHFAWNTGDDYEMSQSILSGCQVSLEKLLIAIREHHIADPEQEENKKRSKKIHLGSKSEMEEKVKKLEAGPLLVKAMKSGTKIVRGRDWKWQNQDGNPRREGTVIGILDDGWIRIRWPTGATNSYRMGKDDKYDIKLADPESHHIGFEDDLTFGRLISREKYTSRDYGRRPTSSILRSLEFLVSSTIGNQCLGAVHSKFLSDEVARIISKRLYKVKHPQNTHPLRKVGDWHSFAFIRMLSSNSKIFCRCFSTSKWLQLLYDVIGHDYCSVNEGNVEEQVQAIWLLGSLLPAVIQDPDRLETDCVSCVNYLFKTLGLLTLGLKLQDPVSHACKNAFMKRNSHLKGISPFADHAGTIAEQFIELLRKLHANDQWQDIISQTVSKNLEFVPTFMSIATKNSQGIDEEKLSFAVGALAMICRTDKRIRVGGTIFHKPRNIYNIIKDESWGYGIVTEIDGGKVTAYFNDDGYWTMHTTEHEDIQPPVLQHEFNCSGLVWSHDFVSLCSRLLKSALTPVAFSSNSQMCGGLNKGAKPKNKPMLVVRLEHTCEEQIELCKLHVHILLLRSLPVLLKDQNVLRNVLKYSPVSEECIESALDNPEIETKEPDEIVSDWSSNAQLSTSCPAFFSDTIIDDMKRCLSDGNLEKVSNNTGKTLFSLRDITVHQGSAVDVMNDAENDLDDSNDATEVTEEYQSDDESENGNILSKKENKMKTTLQETLSLSICPSELKPTIEIHDIDDAVSSLLVFIESTIDQQDIFQDYFHQHLDIPSSVLKINRDDSNKQDALSTKTTNSTVLKRKRSERRERQIEQVRENENLHDDSMRQRIRRRLTRQDNAIHRSSTSPRVPRWSPIPTTEQLELSQKNTVQDSAGLVPEENMRVLRDMGFKDDHIVSCYRELKKRPLLPSQRDVAEGGVLPGMELVVAWLLEHPFENDEDSTTVIDDDIDGFTIIESDMFGENQHVLPGFNEYSSSSDSDSANEEVLNGLVTTFVDSDEENNSSIRFRTSEEFPTSDDYAKYVRENIKVGMIVKCCRSYEDVKEGDTGKVLRLDHDGLNDLNVHAAWASKGGTYWVRYIHVELLRDESKVEVEEAQRQIIIGDKVRVKPSVSIPKYKWGSVKHGSIGNVISISGKDAVVNFDEQQHWTGLLSELQIVGDKHPGITCDSCQLLPIVGVRYKCTVCYNYDMCEKCFGNYPHASPRHTFDMIEKPGSDRIRTTASCPSDVHSRAIIQQSSQDADAPSEDKIEEPFKRTLSFSNVISPKITTKWRKLVDNLEASSGEDSVRNLLDDNDKTCWKSTGAVGEHRLILHMKPGAVVSSLVMQVDPGDSSYMPSLVNISLSCDGKKKPKARTIRIQPSAKHVLLLRDCDKHYNQIAINIKKCKSFGIDCKVHSLSIKGYLLPPKRSSSVSGKSRNILRNQQDADDKKIRQLYLAIDSNENNKKCGNFNGRSAKSVTRGAMSTKVYVWGLNDKDQLGEPKGSKIKTPLFSENLSSVKVAQIVGGSKSLFVLTQEGKVLSCGESTSGRLGLGVVSSNVSTPTLLSHLSGQFVKKVAVHSGGRHAMALTSTGQVFSWGDGDDGKLGHSNRADCHKPRLIETLKTLFIVDIGCGSSHSAAVSVAGALYTWGQGNYGRLGHGDNSTQLKPKIVSSLSSTDVHVIKVACGSRDAQTLCLSKNEQVYSWGDGDFGKLGRGGSEGCDFPKIVDKLNGKGIIQIECGAQFSLALSKTGRIWTWGKGDYFRLGHGHDQHLRHPTIISDLQDKKIVKVAVGALHCLAVTDTGQVYSWGDNDHGQQGNSTTTVNRKPALVEGLHGIKVSNVACGSSHSVAWSVTDDTHGSSFEPIRFPVLKDSLGGSYAPHADFDEKNPSKSILDISGRYYHTKEAKVSKTYGEKPPVPGPTLTRMLLSLSSTEAKKSALNTVLRSLQIFFARTTVTRLLMPSKFIKDDAASPLSKYITNVSESQSLASVRETVSKSENLPSTDLNVESESDYAGPSTSKQASSTSIENVSTSISASDSTHSSIFSKHSKSSDHATVSLIAETITRPEEITLPTPQKLNDLDDFLKDSNDGMMFLKRISDSDIYADFNLEDAKMLSELLKLGVSGRLTNENLAAVSHAVQYATKHHTKITKLLLQRCTSELDEITNEAKSKSFEMRPVIQESTHPYADDSDTCGTVKIQGATSLRIEFDSQCSTESRHDLLTLYNKGKTSMVTQISGRDQSDWSKVVSIQGDEVTWTFKSDGSVNGWGWKFTVYPVCCIGESKTDRLKKLSDDRIMNEPFIPFISQLLDAIFLAQNESQAASISKALVDIFASKDETLRQIVSALTSCIHISLIGYEFKMWALQHLENVLSSFIQFATNYEQVHKVFKPLRSVLPNMLSIQYKYEEPFVRTGKQLMHSPFLRELLSLACDLQLDSTSRQDKQEKLATFSNYFLTKRTLGNLIKRTPFPARFLQKVADKLEELLCDEDLDFPTYEDNSLFTLEIDEQLILWMNKSPSDWTQSWGGSGQIFGWGHNHRGQLGGIDGAKVKVPTICSTLITLQPMSLVGGEQTLYSITADGKVYATGYGASGRLGIGSSDSIALPTLLESIRHVQICKVSVNSGGKHILALSSDGEVYSWGEGGDGKLGHGSRTSCDRPRVIESLRGIDIVEISAGGAHSAAISRRGQLYTWGKGRYGRLGHGDSEDRLRPKLVEVLEPYHVHCVACGSGDAQTVCVTDDHRNNSDTESEGNIVWSWGDGDYGKLGRGGSEMSKVPMQIDGLKNKNIVIVKCGSQFSLALSKSGLVYTWGKGDYFRLGHGADQHVRFPKVVEDIRLKKIVDIATGSLHCLAVSEEGQVYAWGDNDEGQIGNSTTHAAERPILVETLSGQGIDKVACGSAHSLAWSTGSSRNRRKARQSNLPATVPLKYNLLQGLPIHVLRNRLVLLNQFSELFCNTIPFFPLLDESWRNSPHRTLTNDVMALVPSYISPGKFPDETLRGLLVNSGKECAFRKAVQTTMVREKQHGPNIELNRIEIKECKKSGAPLEDHSFFKAVFTQAHLSMDKLIPDSVLLPHRVWKVKFVGESVDDCGGGYSESIAEMCDELENDSVPLLIQTPNGRDEAGANRDCFIFQPHNEENSFFSTFNRMFKFLGILIGIAIRTGSPLSLNFAEPMWKLISGQSQCLTDISEVDKDFLPKLMFIRDADYEELDSMNLPFMILGASGKEVKLSKLHSTVTVSNRNEYIRQSIQFRLHEFDGIVRHIRDGIACVVPLPYISLFTAHELETMVCGSPEIPLSLLKSVASFKGTSEDDKLQKWFWEIMESLTNEEKSLFLRFVWGRTRLPRTIADFRGRDFVIQVLDKYHPPDYYLPESYTCFFLLKLPRYSSKAIMDEKLKYAIYFCKSIDTDDYARMALNGDDEEDLEELIANNNNTLDLIAGHSAAAGNTAMTMVERLRSQVTTTSLNLMSRYTPNISRYLRRRTTARTILSEQTDIDSNTATAIRNALLISDYEDDSLMTSGPDSNSESDSW